MAFKIKGSDVITNNLSGTFENLNINNGSIQFAAIPTSVGSVSGFASGGDPGGNNPGKVIDKFPFASDANATSVGNLANGRSGCGGSSSSTTGYTAGGLYFGAFRPLEKFSMVSGGNGTTIASLATARFNNLGYQSYTHGYIGFGRDFGTVGFATIEKHPFASDTASSIAGTFSVGISDNMAQSSSTDGYSSGGKENSPLVFTNIHKIRKFSFANESSLNDVASLTVGRYAGSGTASLSSGYTMGGSFGPQRYNTIDKFPFATNANATDVGDLTAARNGGAPHSSTTHGYVSGGGNPGVTNQIEKFPFATDANATDIADLTQGRAGLAGHQL